MCIMKKRIVVIIALLLCLILCSCNSSDYKKANDYLANGNYESALEGFEKLGTYKDSANKVKEIKYELACKALDDKDLNKALQLFLDIEDYLDSSDKITEIKQIVKADILDSSVSMFENYKNGIMNEVQAISLFLEDSPPSAKLMVRFLFREKVAIKHGMLKILPLPLMMQH